MVRMSPSVSTQDLAVHLTALPDREVAALLVARPDLAAPPSSSFLALATRAGAQSSVEQALAGLDAPTLAVAEAVVALSRLDESGKAMSPLMTLSASCWMRSEVGFGSLVEFLGVLDISACREKRVRRVGVIWNSNQ